MSDGPRPSGPDAPPAEHNRYAALGPVRRRLRGARLVAVRSVVEFLRDGSPDLAASLTFFGVLSLFPAILAGVSLLGVFGRGEQTVDAVMLMLTEAAPKITLVANSAVRGSCMPPYSSSTEARPKPKAA